jgi:hypothetical protein
MSRRGPIASSALVALAWSLPWTPGALIYVRAAEFISREAARAAANAVWAALVGFVIAFFYKKQWQTAQVIEEQAPGLVPPEVRIDRRARARALLWGSVIAEVVLLLPIARDVLGSGLAGYSEGISRESEWLRDGEFFALLMEQGFWAAGAAGAAVGAISLSLRRRA